MNEEVKLYRCNPFKNTACRKRVCVYNRYALDRVCSRTPEAKYKLTSWGRGGRKSFKQFCPDRMPQNPDAKF